MKNSATHYGAVTKVLHWLIALAIISLLLVGQYMSGLEDGDPNRDSIYGLHKAVGFITLLLVFVRVIWIAYSPVPPLPEAISGRDKKLAKANKHLLYMLMLAAPLSGFLMTSYAGYPVDVFGVFEVPLLVEKSKDLGGIFHEVHEIATYLLIFCLLAHIAGAIKHRRSKNPEEDVLSRMLPGSKSEL